MKTIAVINPDTPDDIRIKLASYDFEILTIDHCKRLAGPIQGHPDLQIFVHDSRLFCHPHISEGFIKSAEKHIEIIICSERLSDKYPDDIFYNIAIAGNFAFHRQDRTSAVIRNYFNRTGISILNVNQGYSRCSTVIVDSNHIITADRGIHNAAALNNVESLLIEPGNVELPGYSYGFLGGATGTFDSTVYFTGRIDHHPDYEKIMEFIHSCGVEVCFLSENRIIDLGSIIFI